MTYSHLKKTTFEVLKVQKHVCSEDQEVEFWTSDLSQTTLLPHASVTGEVELEISLAHFT